MNASIANSREKENLAIPLISSILVTLFLFFIDEGLYSFQWTKDLGTWIAFGIYAGAMFVGQLLIASILFRKFEHQKRAWLSLLIGMPLTLTLVLALFYSRLY